MNGEGKLRAWTWPLVIVRLVPSTTSVYTCMSVCLCGTCLWGQRSISGTVLWSGACAVGVADWSLSSRELHVPAFPDLSSAGLAFLHDFWGFNLGSFICIVSTLPIGSSSQASSYFLKIVLSFWIILFYYFIKNQHMNISYSSHHFLP